MGIALTPSLNLQQVNYQFSRYIAEMANTFSNIYSIGLALHGVFAAQSESLPARYTIGSLVSHKSVLDLQKLPLSSPKGFTFVGIGSFAFHATMLYQAQLADELPMIFVASYANFILFNTRPSDDSSSQRGLPLIAALLSFNILFIWS
jgi:dihydroceramidase